MLSLSLQTVFIFFIFCLFIGLFFVVVVAKKKLF